MLLYWSSVKEFSVYSRWDNKTKPKSIRKYFFSLWLEIEPYFTFFSHLYSYFIERYIKNKDIKTKRDKDKFSNFPTYKLSLRLIFVIMTEFYDPLYLILSCFPSVGRFLWCCKVFGSWVTVSPRKYEYSFMSLQLLLLPEDEHCMKVSGVNDLRQCINHSPLILVLPSAYSSFIYFINILIHTFVRHSYLWCVI